MAAATSLPHSKAVSWYLAGPPTLPAKIKDLLRDWSAINPSDAEKHVERIREEAWEVHQYPCREVNQTVDIIPVGGYRFLTLGLAIHPSFDTIVTSLKSGGQGQEAPIFVDLGCCVGQDLRSLAQTGVAGTHLVGIDLEPAFFKIGHDLFQDKGKLGAQFIVADVMTLEDSTPHPLSHLMGQVSVLWASAFFHLWNLEGQTALCRKVLMLLQNKPGTRILGRHVGSRTPGEKAHVTNKSGLMYRHNPETFSQMWSDVLGCEEDVDQPGLFRSLNHGTWKVRAWFEEDRPEEVHNAPVGDWLTKVAKESEGDVEAKVETPASQDTRAIFITWDMERTE